MALSSAMVILVQSVGKLFGFEIDGGTIENVIMSICGVLVVLGIVTKQNTVEETKDNKVETIQDINEKEEINPVNESQQSEEIVQESLVVEELNGIEKNINVDTYNDYGTNDGNTVDNFVEDIVIEEVDDEVSDNVEEIEINMVNFTTDEIKEDITLNPATEVIIENTLEDDEKQEVINRRYLLRNNIDLNT